MIRKLRSMSLALALCIGITALAGCTGNAGTAETTAAAGNTAAGSTSDTTTAAPAEAKTLRIGIFAAGREEDPNVPGEFINENWATNYVIEKFGKPNNIDVKFEIIDDTNDSGPQNIQILMASKKAPDLFSISVGDVPIVHTFAESGGLADLQPALDQYGSNLKTLLTEEFIKKNGTFYGKLYSIPGQEAIPAISHYWIRQDWLDVLKLQMPTNFDDWYSVMKAFKQRAPELQAAGLVKNAKDVVPYAMYHVKYFTPWERIVARFYPTKYFDDKNAEYYIYSGYGTEYLKEGFKEGMQFINQMYNEGLISKNFALDEDEKQFQRDIIAGNAGSYCANLFNGWGPSDPESWHNLLKQNIPEAKFEWCNAFTNKYDNVARSPLDNPVLSYPVVPSFSQSVEEAVKYLDFTAVSDNMINIQYGELDKSYVMDPVLGPMRKDEAALKAWGHSLNNSKLVMIGRLPDRKWSRIQRSGAKTKEEAEYAEKIHLGIESPGYERFPGILSTAPEKSLVGGLRTPWQKLSSNLIMAKPGKFEEAWTAGTKELEANGSLKVVEGYKKVVKEKLGIDVK